MRYVAKTLPTALGAIVIFVSLVSSFGYQNTGLITAFLALVLWVLADRAVEKASPQLTPTAREPKAGPTSSPRKVCAPGPYRVDAGGHKDIPLDVRRGDRVKGHLKEVEGQLFDWYIADEDNMVFFKQRNFRKFKPIDGGSGEPACPVNQRIPRQARWYLILDMYGLKNDREVHVDFEDITPKGSTSTSKS